MVYKLTTKVTKINLLFKIFFNNSYIYFRLIILYLKVKNLVQLEDSVIF